MSQLSSVLGRLRMTFKKIISFFFSEQSLGVDFRPVSNKTRRQDAHVHLWRVFVKPRGGDDHDTQPVESDGFGGIESNRSVSPWFGEAFRRRLGADLV